MITALPETHRKFPLPQEQQPPGSQELMRPHPIEEDDQYVADGKLEGKVAIITGADSGLGRSIALLFAREGAEICIVYSNEHENADKTMARIEEFGRRVIKFNGDIAEPAFCDEVVQRTINAFGRIDILVNNAGEQDEISGVEDLEPRRVEKIFRTNIFGFFYLTKATLPRLKEGAAIINTTSVQAYDPSPHLMDDACTKAAILNFTRSLAKELAERKIRVNAVASGPNWPPLIPTFLAPDELNTIGPKTPFKPPRQPVEVAPAFLFFAAESDSAFITGQVLHVNGGQGIS